MRRHVKIEVDYSSIESGLCHATKHGVPQKYKYLHPGGTRALILLNAMFV